MPLYVVLCICGVCKMCLLSYYTVVVLSLLLYLMPIMSPQCI